jgi:hypothetical protein
MMKINATPTNGRNVTSERMGQSCMPQPLIPYRYHVTSTATPMSMAKA